jgi:hypothetical protein
MNHTWKGKLYIFYHAASKWGAPDHVLKKLFKCISDLNHNEIKTDLYETARLTARLANRANLAQHHKEPKLTQLANSRWIREVGSDL